MSQVNKLSFVDGKLGAPTSGQQTTRIIFNTIENPGTTSGLVFFRNFQGLTAGQTNLTENKLASMESMVIKSIYLTQLLSTSVRPFGGAVQQVVSIIVGNQTVVKNLPIHFNAGATGQPFDRLHDNGGVASLTGVAPSGNNQFNQPIEIRLLTDIVIPPQVTFEVRIDSNNAAYEGGAVLCALAGYGKIFSAGNSF